MDNRQDETDGSHWFVWSSLFAVFVLSLAGYLNYTEPYSFNPVTNPTIWEMILWGLLYIPIIILPITTGLKVTDFGFTLNPFLAIAIFLILTICTISNLTAMTSWRSAFIEAFARTGEEIFFRGFLFILFLDLFQSKRRPWLWAAVASSILFALVHTQTFQPGYLDQFGSPSMPAGYQIVERLLNVFGLGLFFALIRVWSHSILPGAIAHGLSAAGITTLPFVLLIYGMVTIWAYYRNESTILRADGFQLT